MSLKARDEGVSGIIGQVLNIPVTCHPKHFPTCKYEFESYEQNKDASIIDKAKMNWFWGMCVPALKEPPPPPPPGRKTKRTKKN